MLSDNKLIYDLDEHKYILTREYLENRLNVNLLNYLNLEASMSPDADINIFLYRVSNLLYTFIYAYSENPDDMEYYLSLTETPKQLKNRECIGKCLLELAYEILINNKEQGVFFSDKLDFDIIPNQTKQMLYATGLITRSKLVGLPSDYIIKRGVEY